MPSGQTSAAEAPEAKDEKEEAGPCQIAFISALKDLGVRSYQSPSFSFELFYPEKARDVSEAKQPLPGPHRQASLQEQYARLVTDMHTARKNTAEGPSVAAASELLEDTSDLSEADRLDEMMVNDPAAFEQAMIDMEKDS